MDLTHRPAFTVRNFAKALEEEASRPARGQYVFVHLTVPHPPFIFSKNYIYMGHDWSWRYRGDRHAQQAECSLRLMERLIVRLSEHSTYRNRLESTWGTNALSRIHPKSTVQTR